MCPRNLPTIRDALGRTTKFAYDSHARQIGRTLPEGQFEEKRYDAQGRLALEISFEGVVTAYAYADTSGSGGRLLEKRYFETLTAYNNAQGTPSEITTYTYDAFGRTHTVTQDRDGGQRIVTNGYDPSYGSLISVASPEGTIHYEYNAVTGARERTWTGTDQGDPDTDTRYDYDPLGRLDAVRAVARNGAAITPEEVTDYVYDLLGNLDQVRLPTLPKGVVSDYDYDSVNRLEFLRQFRDENDNHTYEVNVDAVLAEFDYDLLPDGKRSGVKETQWFDDNSDGILESHRTRTLWVYDGVGRLTGELMDTYGEGDALDYITRYTFDLVGNRRTKATSHVAIPTDPAPTDAALLELLGDPPAADETITYAYDANDRVLTEAKNLPGNLDDRFTEYGYDGTDQTSKTVHGPTDAEDTTVDANDPVVEETDYSYNLQGRMDSAEISTYDATGQTLQSHTESSYEYNDHGIRVRQTQEVDTNNDGDFDDAGVDTSERTDYLVDNLNPTGYSQVLEEKDAAGTIQKTYTLGLDVIAQILANNARHFLLHDGHGSSRGLVDALGLPLSGEIYRYDAFGNAVGFNAANALTSHLYNSEPFLGSIGLYDFRDRLYDPLLGGFPTPDRFFGDLRNPLTFNKYLFVHGDGVNFNDPSGLSEGLVGLMANIAVQSIIAAMVSAAVMPVVAKFAGYLLPDWYVTGLLTAKSPDAYMLGLGAATSVPIGTLPFGFTNGAGVEGLWSPHTGYGAVYTYLTAWGINAGAGNWSFEASLNLGLVWSASKSKDYTEHFATWSLPFAGLPQPVAQKLEYTYLELSAIPVVVLTNAGALPGVATSLTLVTLEAVRAVSAMRRLAYKLTFNTFYDPTKSFGDGAWGASLSIPLYSYSSGSSSHKIAYSRSFYWQLLPRDANGNPETVAFR